MLRRRALPCYDGLPGDAQRLPCSTHGPRRLVLVTWRESIREAKEAYPAHWSAEHTASARGNQVAWTHERPEDKPVGRID